MADFEQLQAFVTAAQTGSFSAAARKLGKVQSAVSTAIANLEIDLNLTLFDRSGYRPELTEAGVRVLRHAQSVLDEVLALQADADALADLPTPQLTFYVEQGLWVPRVGDMVAALADTFPAVELCCGQMPRPALMTALHNGGVDLAFVTGADRLGDGFRTRGIGFQRLVPVCRADHPLAHVGEVTRAMLKQHRQIVGPEDAQAPKAQRRLSPQIWRSEDAETQLDLVLAGLGWAECAVDRIAPKVAEGQLAVLEYAFEQNAILDTVGLVTTAKPANTRIQTWVLDHIAQWDQKAWVGPSEIGRKRHPARHTP